MVIFLSLNVYFFINLQKNNTVVEVVDGDTFQLYSGKRVRLLCVDAPEYNRCGGVEARKRLSELILNKRVFLKEEIPETFGRSLALVYHGNKLINKIILEERWGRTDYRKNSQREILTAAFHQAQKYKSSIWGSFSTDSLIKGNIDKNNYKKFYHLPGCKHYNQIVIEKDIGERYFCTEQEAVAAGFIKASDCP